MQNAPGGATVYRLGSRHSFLGTLLASDLDTGGLGGLVGFLLGYDGGSCSCLLVLAGSDGALDRDDQATEVVQILENLHRLAESAEQDIKHLIVGAVLVEPEDALLHIATTTGGSSEVGVLVRIVGCGLAIKTPAIAQLADELDGFFLVCRDSFGPKSAHQELPGGCNANVGGVGFRHWCPLKRLIVLDYGQLMPTVSSMNRF
ncbi:hypothetical protein C0580_01380 [Candidatus Parcubacteria bacterium]|nr:MAG: hypothetical protein C0580_01380 [Candidatus Parcubacteria bacterium]